MELFKILNPVIQIGTKVWYVILYYILGFKSMIEDVSNKKYNKIDPKDKSGYVAVVTGGARGIGSQLVKLLMQCNMHVVIGCREIETGKKLISEIRKSGVDKGDASILYLNLMSLNSIHNFAREVLQNHDNINLLVNNAGVMFLPFSVTEDGYERHFAVNYLGHFLLSQLLLPAMKKGPTAPRIVNVASCAHELAPRVNLDNLDMKKNYIEHVAYANSKLYQIMFTKALTRRLQESGSPVIVIAVHPGVVNTDIFEGTLVKLAAPWFLNLLCKKPIEGATSVLYGCISDELEERSGVYVSNCQLSKCTKIAEDVNMQEKLYEASMEAVKKFLN